MFYAFARFVAGCLYRVTVHGRANVPEGGALLLPNHSTWVDAVVLQLACPRPVRFLVFEGIYKIAWLNPIFRIIGAIPISSTRARSALDGAAAGLDRGEIVCIFPEGELSRTGNLLRLKRGFELIARETGAPVVPAFLDDLWGSIFSFDKGRYFTKWPKRVPYHVTVAFGDVIPAGQATTALVRERLLALGEFCYEQRPMLRGHLGVSVLRGLKGHFGRVAVVDGMDSSSITAGKILGVAIALARDLQRNYPSKRIAIVLPPGKGAVIANAAVLLAGKVPVNMNFTTGRAALESAMRRGEIPCAISAHAVAKRFQEFPWPKDVIHLETALPKMKKRIITWVVLSRILPAWTLKAILKLPPVGDRDEAVLLFTSGSSGEPKGVPLSHRNLLGNVSQFGQMLELGPEDAMLACLPFFHSFGCTVTLWYCLIEGVRSVTYPSPLEVAKNAELIHKHRVTMLLSTATFLRGYLRKATPEQLASLNLVVVGAEKLPRDLAETFEAKFGKHVHEGYGLTETAPVVSVNLPDPPTHGRESVQPANRPGSVGKLAPGIAAQIRHPDTGAALTLQDTGMLWLRGPNVFGGYLNDPERTAEVLEEGWFKTGDLGRFDEDGFLYIEGRLSRFSKIAGEMVPHETIEKNICAALGVSPEDERVIAIAGIPDEAKGEALVLVASREIDMASLRTKLTEAGLPNLWIPKIQRRIDKIPVLSTGKLDLAGIKAAALEPDGPAEA
jgi:acyl-[acyl-carrier-protein]-phospholipid O-acyltransferase/long-chain-fatty-acid--[acyl-carrier-protein] ligase